MSEAPRLIEKDCFLRVAGGGGTIYFQMMPEITDSKSVNWNMVDVVGRSHPLLGYTSSSCRTFSFSLEFFAHASQRDNRPISQIKQEIDLLMSLTYPDYGSGSVLPPKKCILKLGNMVVFPVVAQDISVTYHTLWDKASGLPIHASVSCTFIEAHNNPISYTQIKSGSRMTSL